MPDVTSAVVPHSFKVGDFPSHYLNSNQLLHAKDFEGTWEDIKKISQPIDSILVASGVGFIKRKATSIATLKTVLKLESVDAAGNPVYHLKTFYPLGIVKECMVHTDGTTIELNDPDTCHWKCESVWVDGRLIQKRTGSKGVMFDSRIVFKSHPTGAVSDAPVMLFLWTLIAADGTKHQAECWLRKVA